MLNPVKTNLNTLQEGLDLLAQLSSEQYTASHRPLFIASIGAHYRHFIEHYQCFFQQLGTSDLCFDSRNRDSRIESSRQLATKAIEEVRAQLQHLETQDLSATVLLHDQQSESPVHTSIARELLFLQAHTVHHYAIIAAMARNAGVRPANDFGVAIATRQFEADQAESA